jgi:hypothetical protein
VTNGSAKPQRQRGLQQPHTFLVPNCGLAERLISIGGLAADAGISGCSSDKCALEKPTCSLWTSMMTSTSVFSLTSPIEQSLVVG